MRQLIIRILCVLLAVMLPIVWTQQVIASSSTDTSKSRMLSTTFNNPDGNFSIFGDQMGIVRSAKDARIGQLGAKFYW